MENPSIWRKILSLRLYTRTVIIKRLILEDAKMRVILAARRKFMKNIRRSSSIVWMKAFLQDHSKSCSKRPVFRRKWLWLHSFLRGTITRRWLKFLSPSLNTRCLIVVSILRLCLKLRKIYLGTTTTPNSMLIVASGKTPFLTRKLMGLSSRGPSSSRMKVI